jgi:hypothetical protein
LDQFFIAQGGVLCKSKMNRFKGRWPEQQKGNPIAFLASIVSVAG